MCVAPNANGPITSCNYSSLNPFLIIDGLPPGDTIETEIVLLELTSILVAPGGSLGGEVETANAKFDMTMAGTGGLVGYNRVIQMPISFEAHSAPRNPVDPVQVFDTDMFMLQGQIPPGDPDFDLLRITAGTNFGLPSPGHTTLTNIGGNNWAVDSFFDITYRIDFVGAPGGPFAGMSGSTTGTTRIVSEDSSPDIDGDGIPDADDPAPNDPCNPNPNSQACERVIGGEIIQVENTSLLLAGVQTNLLWLAPIILAGTGFAAFNLRRK